MRLSALDSLSNLRSLKLRIYRGLSRRMPDGFAQTLAGLPRVSVSISFAIQDRISEGDWADEGPLLTPEDSQVDSIHCQLVFLDPPHTSSNREVVFVSFRAAIKKALPGFKLELKRVDEEPSYIAGLPW